MVFHWILTLVNATHVVTTVYNAEQMFVTDVQLGMKLLAVNALCLVIVVTTVILVSVVDNAKFAMKVIMLVQVQMANVLAALIIVTHAVMVHHVLHVLMDTTMMLMKAHVFLKENVLPMSVIAVRLLTAAARVKKMKKLPSWVVATRTVVCVLTFAQITQESPVLTTLTASIVSDKASAWNAKMVSISKNMLVIVLLCLTAGTHL